MIEARERELLNKVPTLNSFDELTSFREAIRQNDGEMTTSLFAALIERADYLRKKEKGNGASLRKGR